MTSTTETTAARYIVMTATAAMPNSVKAPYRRVAVVELDGSGIAPKMISTRARGVARIVQTWERVHAGYSQSDRTAYGRAYAEAAALASALNAEAK